MVELNICYTHTVTFLRSYSEIIMPIFVFLFRGTSMDCILPYIIKLLVLSSYIIMQYWLSNHIFQFLSRLFPVVNVFAWRTHLCHVKDILGIWILLLL